MTRDPAPGRRAVIGRSVLGFTASALFSMGFYGMAVAQDPDSPPPIEKGLLRVVDAAVKPAGTTTPLHITKCG
jgi:hypothetical protein